MRFCFDCEARQSSSSCRPSRWERSGIDCGIPPEMKGTENRRNLDPENKLNQQLKLVF